MHNKSFKKINYLKKTKIPIKTINNLIICYRKRKKKPKSIIITITKKIKNTTITITNKSKLKLNRNRQLLQKQAWSKKIMTNHCMKTLHSQLLYQSMKQEPLP